MDMKTQQFVSECLKQASVDIYRVRTPEEIAEEQMEIARIRLSGAYALERLERNGGVRVNYN
ncbi:MAG: hypothetical protein AABX54_04540 [Nanoarchaeota archaeon]